MALLCVQSFRMISQYTVVPKYLEKNILGIEVTETTKTVSNAKEPLQPIAPLMATANVQNGEKIAKKCVQCHGFEKGGAHKTGPNLWNMVMHPIAEQNAYAYSTALKEHKGKKWTYEDLNAFLYKPREYARGTKMSFIGLKKPQDRADIIAYMHSKSDNPVPLP